MIINMNGAKAPETPSSVLQEKTVTPETLPTVIGPDAGYDGLSQVTVNPDAQLKAENIRSGKTIFGVAGAFVGEPTYVNNIEYSSIKNGINYGLNYPMGYIWDVFSDLGEGSSSLDATSRRYSDRGEYVGIGIQSGSISSYTTTASYSAPYITSQSYIPSSTWYHDTSTFNGTYKCYLENHNIGIIGADSTGHIEGTGWVCPVMYYYTVSGDKIQTSYIQASSYTHLNAGEIIPVNVNSSLTKDSTGRYFTIDVPSTEVDGYVGIPSYMTAYKKAAGLAFIPNKIVIS